MKNRESCSRTSRLHRKRCSGHFRHPKNLKEILKSPPQKRSENRPCQSFQTDRQKAWFSIGGGLEGVLVGTHPTQKKNTAKKEHSSKNTSLPRPTRSSRPIRPGGEFLDVFWWPFASLLVHFGPLSAPFRLPLAPFWLPFAPSGLHVASFSSLRLPFGTSLDPFYSFWIIRLQSFFQNHVCWAPESAKHLQMVVCTQTGCELPLAPLLSQGPGAELCRRQLRSAPGQAPKAC